MGAVEIKAGLRPAEVSEREKLLFYVDPGYLLQQNPPIFIENEASYRLMVNGFDPVLCEPVKIARVRTHEGDVRIAIVDGFTRTKFHNDNIAKKHPNAPGYDFSQMLVWDQTKLLLKNSYINGGNYDPERAELTELEYYRAIVEHVKGHADISAARIAAHTIIVWKSLVGSEIASKFPVTAALSLLEEVRPHFYDRDTLLGELVRNYSQRLDVNMGEQEVIFTALADISQVIKDANLDIGSVSGEVFRMLAVCEDYIGGTNEAAAEIQRILNDRVAVEKLRSVYRKNPASLERIKLKTARRIVKSLSSKADNTAGASLKIMRQVLLDKRLDWRTTIAVIFSDDIVGRYGEEIANYHRMRLRQIYQERTGSKDLGETEQLIINNLGSVIHISHNELERMVTGIKAAVPVVKDALMLKQHLALMSKQSSNQDLDKALQNLLTAKKVSGLTRSRKRLEGVIAKIRGSLEVGVENKGRVLSETKKVDRKDSIGPNRIMELSISACVRSIKRQIEALNKQRVDVSPGVYDAAEELLEYFKEIGLIKK